jgi:hypothetical protein
MTIRVIQWATGSVGKILLQEIIQNPDYELVGVLVYGADKVGKDAADLVGLKRPTGVIATNDKAKILALQADLVLHASSKAYSFETNTDDLVALLESGKNVITTTSYVHLGILDPAVEQRIQQACRIHHVRFHGTGEHPGWLVERLAATMTAVCQRVDQIIMRQYVDCFRVPERRMLVDLMGMGKQPEEISDQSPAFRAVSTQSEQAMAATADVLGLKFDEIRHSIKTGTLDRDLPVLCTTLAAGTVVGQVLIWTAYKANAPVLTCEEYWTCTDDIPGWNLALKGHTVDLEVLGVPNMSINLKIDVHGVAEFGGASGGHVAVAMAAVRAVDEVLKAPPGVVVPTVWGAYRYRS